MIAKKIQENMQKGSMIRQMFEEGKRLKELHGPENVYDFSLGNPDLEPPAAVNEALARLVNQPRPGLHSYMSNSGHAHVRQTVADLHSRLAGLDIPADNVCMTVGAAGALNISLKALLDPGDEVIVLAPFFFEYLSYIDNHGGVPVVVACDKESLLPDLKALAASITARTKAIIINSPNNPSGVIYPKESLLAINELLLSLPQTIYVLSDEPYADLVYDGAKTPPTLAFIKNAIICTSWSKSLSLPGERIGCVVVSPNCTAATEISQAAVYCNRILGFVNAPALFQEVIGQAIAAKVDLAQYEKRRDLLTSVLQEAGFKVNRPAGGLYLFPACPDPDDQAFARKCAGQHILLVPGSAFAFAGFFRLCFAVPEKTILGSAKAFQAIGQSYGLV